VVWEGWRREASPYPDQQILSGLERRTNSKNETRGALAHSLVPNAALG
jgi:hypothetical protein